MQQVTSTRVDRTGERGRARALLRLERLLALHPGNRIVSLPKAARAEGYDFAIELHGYANGETTQYVGNTLAAAIAAVPCRHDSVRGSEGSTRFCVDCGERLKRAAESAPASASVPVSRSASFLRAE
jgi:hypothetical protein